MRTTSAWLVGNVSAQATRARPTTLCVPFEDGPIGPTEPDEREQGYATGTAQHCDADVHGNRPQPGGPALGPLPRKRGFNGPRERAEIAHQRPALATLRLLGRVGQAAQPVSRCGPRAHGWRETLAHKQRERGPPHCVFHLRTAPSYRPNRMNVSKATPREQLSTAMPMCTEIGHSRVGRRWGRCQTSAVSMDPASVPKLRTNGPLWPTVRLLLGQRTAHGVRQAHGQCPAVAGDKPEDQVVSQEEDPGSVK